MAKTACGNRGNRSSQKGGHSVTITKHDIIDTQNVKTEAKLTPAASNIENHIRATALVFR